MISKELLLKSLSFQSAFFKIGRSPSIKGSSRSTELNSNLIVNGPVFEIFSIFFQLFKYLGWPTVPIVSNDQITSATVTEEPSENFASGLNANSTHSRFGPTSILSANRPYNEKGSSQFLPIKLSTTCALTPQGDLPFLM